MKEFNEVERGCAELAKMPAQAFSGIFTDKDGQDVSFYLGYTWKNNSVKLTQDASGTRFVQMGDKSFVASHLSGDKGRPKAMSEFFNIICMCLKGGGHTKQCAPQEAK